MKKFLAFSLIALFFAIGLLINNSMACPTGTPVWSGPASVTISFPPCSLTVTYCYRIDEFGFHQISFQSISIWGGGSCNGTFYDANRRAINDLFIIAIAQGPIVAGLWGLTIPEYPNCLCLLKYYDAFCYKGWVPDDQGGWGTDVCNDGLVRDCNQTILICKQQDNSLLVTRSGSPEGEQCPEECPYDNCDVP
jgi:hypothetical protein